VGVEGDRRGAEERMGWGRMEGAGGGERAGMGVEMWM
jgi:hypothetical protein